MSRRLPVLLLLSVLAACGGGGGAASPVPHVANPAPVSAPSDAPEPGPAATPTPSPTPGLPASETQSASMGAAPVSVTFSPIASGAAGTVSLPAIASGSAQATLTLESSLPAGAPVPQARFVRGIAQPQTLNGSVTPIAFFALSVGASATAASTVGFSLTFAPGTLSGYGYVAFYDPANSSAGWRAIAGPVSASGTAIAFPSTALSSPQTFAAKTSYLYAIVETGTPLPTPAPAATPPPTPAPHPSATPAPAPTPDTAASPLPNVSSRYGWSPSDIADALHFPVQHGFDGARQTIAILMDAYPSMSDVDAYLSHFHVPQTGRTIVMQASVDGPPAQSADAAEATLDTETIASLAPGANILFYGMPSLDDQTFIDTMEQVVNDGKASVVSFSATGCEYSGETPNSVLSQAAKAGIAIVSSSGDQGNECWSGPNTYQPGIGWPGADPSVFSIGGTETQIPNFPLTSNRVWNDRGCSTGQCASGGGVSRYLALPSYQQGVSGESSTAFRNVPDLSMPAVDAAVYAGGRWQTMAGTSWSAPQYAALVAELYQYCGTAIDDPVALPYDVLRSDPGEALVDVTQGNDQFESSTPYYSAGPGYDDASGVGVPFGMEFANAVCPNRAPSAAVRRPFSMTAYAPHRAAKAFEMNATPPVRAVTPIGPRGAAQITRVQIVLRPAANAASDERAVAAALQAAGFTLLRTFGNHLVVDAQAPSAAVERLFRTRMENVSEGPYGTRYMPFTRIVVPASLAPYANAVNLDDVVSMHPPLHAE